MSGSSIGRLQVDKLKKKQMTVVVDWDNEGKSVIEWKKCVGNARTTCRGDMDSPICDADIR